MDEFFSKWALRVSSSDDQAQFLLRARRTQTSLASALCLLVLASAALLIETDRRITRAIQELSNERGFEQHVRENTLSMAERYPPPALVVLVSLSGLRADRVGAYGNETSTTPTLDALARQSVTFATTGAQASHPLVSNKSFLTGMYPSSLMLDSTGADLVALSSLPAPREFLVRTFVGVDSTLPAHMRAAGYRTAAFTDGDWTCRENGFERGFEVFEEGTQGLGENLEQVRNHLHQKRGERGFVFVHSSELAAPFDAPEEFAVNHCPDHTLHSDLSALCEEGAAEDGSWTEENLVALGAHYDAAVENADAQLSQLVDTLHELGVFERTLLVVTAGHGTSLGERGLIGNGQLALEQLLVPLIVKLPADWNVEPRSVDEPVELVDVMPSILSASGVRAPSGIDGQSFLSIALRNVRGRDYLLAQTAFDESFAVPANAAKRMLLAPGQWQVVHDPIDNDVEFFQLEQDPQALRAIRDLSEIEVPPILRRLVGRTPDTTIASSEGR